MCCVQDKENVCEVDGSLTDTWSYRQCPVILPSVNEMT